jgi:hypothetical protein
VTFGLTVGAFSAGVGTIVTFFLGVISLIGALRDESESHLTGHSVSRTGDDEDLVVDLHTARQ